MSIYGDFAFKTTEDITKSILGTAFPVRTTNTGGYFSRATDKMALKAGLIQLILTRRGERVMMPDFGTDIREAVFAPLDMSTAATLGSQISTTISKYEKRVILKNLDVVPDESNNTLSIALTFSVKENILGSASLNISVTQRGFSIT